ncbi:hypothetical protein R3W88_027153 [Solanum pinnatisectum]|uniref:Uncharacterized protein n=1 Tax=Solanum pinnatisectum TaxID=50273 RepID=A0AAV9LFD0_9SOLN|nr:hypothetical protein R3W88_027153 [Solanum pinnatisectum]
MSEIGKKPRASTKGESISSSFGGFTTNLTRRNRGMPLTQEQDERVWLDLIGGLSRYGYVYGMPQQTFREYHSEFEGLSSSYDDESMKKNLAMEQKIVELSSQVEDSWARERRRDIEYASQPTRYPVYGQQRNMIDESSSDEGDEDHVANTLPH